MKVFFLLVLAIFLPIWLPLQAQNKFEVTKIIIELDNIKSDLSLYYEAYQYTAGLLEDIKQRKKPRKPKTFVSGKTDDHLNTLAEKINNVAIPAVIDSTHRAYKVDVSEIKGNPQQKKGAATKLIAYNKALRKQIDEMEVISQRLQEIEYLANKMNESGIILSKVFQDYAENPLVKAFFKDMFGYQWYEVEIVLLPQVRNLKSKASSKLKILRDELAKRQLLLDNSTSNLILILPTLGFAIPTDIVKNQDGR